MFLCVQTDNTQIFRVTSRKQHICEKKKERTSQILILHMCSLFCGGHDDIYEEKQVNGKWWKKKTFILCDPSSVIVFFFLLHGFSYFNLWKDSTTDSWIVSIKVSVSLMWSDTKNGSFANCWLHSQCLGRPDLHVLQKLSFVGLVQNTSNLSKDSFLKKKQGFKGSFLRHLNVLRKRSHV